MIKIQLDQTICLMVFGQCWEFSNRPTDNRSIAMYLKELYIAVCRSANEIYQEILIVHATRLLMNI